MTVPSAYNQPSAGAQERERRLAARGHRLTNFNKRGRLYRCMMTNKLSTRADRKEVARNTPAGRNQKARPTGKKLRTIMISCTISAWQPAFMISVMLCVLMSNYAAS